MIQIFGDQYVESGDIRHYTVTGIPSGYTLDSLQLPTGWAISATGAIVSGQQEFNLSVGIGSGTLVATYTDGAGLYQVGYLDVYSSATRMGEEITRSAIIIPVVNPVVPVAFCEDTSACVYSLPVLADPADPTNALNNDKSEFYFYGNAAITAITMTLQKAVGSNGIFSDIVTLIDGSYGQFIEYGKSVDFLGNAFTDDYGKKYTGVFLDWLLVYNDYGAGNYRMKVQQTDVFSGVTTSYSKAQYCLKKYNCHFTEGTIRIEILNQGLRGTLDDLTAQIDYSTGWNGQIRLKGLFKQLEPGYNKEYNQYGDGDNNAYKPIIDEQIPKYKLQIKPVPGWLDWYISTNVLQADRILVTDYNSRSRHTFIRVPVKDGVMKILNEEYKNPLAVIEIEFVLGQNNLRRRNS